MADKTATNPLGLDAVCPVCGEWKDHGPVGADCPLNELLTSARRANEQGKPVSVACPLCGRDHDDKFACSPYLNQAPERK